jgi:hypothetical protein
MGRKTCWVLQRMGLMRLMGPMGRIHSPILELLELLVF